MRFVNDKQLFAIEKQPDAIDTPAAKLDVAVPVCAKFKTLRPPAKLDVAVVDVALNDGEVIALYAVTAPRTSALLYDGSLSTLLGGRQLSVSSWSGRASCELHIQFTPAPTLPAAPISCPIMALLALLAAVLA